MRKSTIRFIEDELFHYDKNLKEIQRIKTDIYDESPNPPDGMPRGTDTSNPTENKVMRILTTKQILSLENRLLAIRKVINRYQDNPIMSQLIKLRYFDKTKTPTGIMLELNISQATFYRYRAILLEDIGNELGLL